MANPDLPVIGYRAGNAERLQPLTESDGHIGRLGLITLDGHRRTDQIGPAGIFKGNRLNRFDDLSHIDAAGQTQLLGLVQRGDAIGRKKRGDLGNPSFISLKQSHGRLLIPCVG